MDTLQENIAKGIVNIFETGRLLGDYASVVLTAGDSGHLTYGRSQTTLASGNLGILISNYCASPGAAYQSDLQPYLARLRARDLTLDNDVDLRRILAQAGADPTMRQVQDDFFDRSFWQIATRRAANDGVTTALGVATLYDSTIHGSYPDIRSSTDAVRPRPRQEKDWILAYVAIRRAWLANNVKPGLRPCVYRMDELKKIGDGGNWDLQPPLVVRGITITAKSFDLGVADVQGQLPVRASAHDASEVALTLLVPYMTGPSVELVQHALVVENLLSSDAIDGTFGPLTASLVKQFQVNHGLKADGVVGPATWAVVREVTAA